MVLYLKLSDQLYQRLERWGELSQLDGGELESPPPYMPYLSGDMKRSTLVKREPANRGIYSSIGSEAECVGATAMTSTSTRTKQEKMTQETKQDMQEIATPKHANPGAKTGLRQVVISRSKLLILAKKYHTSIWELVRGCEPYVTQDTKRAEFLARPKTEEYTQLMKKLREEQQEKEYQELIQSHVTHATTRSTLAPIGTNGNSNTNTNTNFAHEAKIVKEQLTTVVNIVITAASVVAALWYWTGNGRWNESWRVLLCVFGGLLTLIAEVVVYLGYIRRVNEARSQEQQLKEKTYIISSEVIGPSISGGIGGDGSKNSQLRQRRSK